MGCGLDTVNTTHGARFGHWVGYERHIDIHSSECAHTGQTVQEQIQVAQVTQKADLRRDRACSW